MSRSIDEDAGALATILKTLPGFVLLVDHEGVIRYINRVEEGFDRDTVIGTPAVEFLFADSSAEFEAALASLLSTGEPQEFDVAVELPNRSVAWYRSRLLPYRSEGRGRGAVILGTNVTELRQAQETLGQLRRLLPMCAWCDRIRDEDGNWETIEQYLARDTDTAVTHVICPECYRRQMPAEEGAGAP